MGREMGPREWCVRCGQERRHTLWCWRMTRAGKPAHLKETVT